MRPRMAKTKLETSPLQAHLGYWMRLVSNSVSQSFAQRLEASGVTVAEWVVLREMYGGDDKTSPSAIAELTGLTRGAVSKLIERLRKKRLVTRDEAPGDRRFQDIQLTPQAIALLPRLAAIADKNDHDFFSQLTAKERNQLAEILTKMARIHGLAKAPIE